MASNHQCHCHPTPPTPITTCYCTTTHYSSPPPPPPPSDPLVHSIYSHHHHPPPQTHYHAPPQNHHNYHPPPPPNQIQQKHQLFQKYHQQENPPPLNPTVSSLIHRITALESILRRSSNQSPRSSPLRDSAARAIQTHFRAFLVRRSVTLRHLKDLAYIKSTLSHLKSFVSNKTHFDSYFISRESMNLLIKLDSIQGSDPMIRDGKRSISRELIRFMELIDQISKESQLISVKNVRFSKTRASGSQVFGDNERKLAENFKNRINKIKISSVSKTEENEMESLEIENPRKPGVSQIRIGGLTKGQRVVNSQPKVKKNVSFDENGNVYRLIKSNHSLVLSDGSDSSNGDDEQVEEIVSSKETEVVEEEEEEEDSSEISEYERDPRKNLNIRIHHTTKKNQPNQEVDDDDDDDEDDDEDDNFVLSAPLPAKMEYRVDSVNKKQTRKH